MKPLVLRLPSRGDRKSPQNLHRSPFNHRLFPYVEHEIRCTSLVGRMAVPVGPTRRFVWAFQLREDLRWLSISGDGSYAGRKGSGAQSRYAADHGDDQGCAA